MSVRKALDRTLLLMRDDVSDEALDSDLLRALTETEIALVADKENLHAHSAQCAFVTAAMLMARSGHRIYLVARDLELRCSQPPLAAGSVVESLMEIGPDLLPEYAFVAHDPRDNIDLAVILGDTPWHGRAKRAVRINAQSWKGCLLGPNHSRRWLARDWPFGALAAANLAATEAFKISMRKLDRFARNNDLFEQLLKPCEDVGFELAPPETRYTSMLAAFDLISAGAISNAVLYTIARIPNVTGRARVIDADTTEISNLNRYLLLLYSRLRRYKSTDLATLNLVGLKVSAVTDRYLPETSSALTPFAPAVLVGVDDIPTRWEVQKANPHWLGIGATTHWSAMASFHSNGLPCARCLHSSSDIDDQRIPTAAFVSFWAGLMLATYFVRNIAGEAISPQYQQTYLTSLRPELPWRSPVAWRSSCPLCAVKRHRAQT